MRRRELLAGVAGVAGAAVVGLPRAAAANPVTGLAAALTGASVDAVPMSLLQLTASVARVRRDFEAARYGAVSRALPGLIGSASAIRDTAASGQAAETSGVLAEVHLAASALLVKANDDQLAGAAADRAVRAAVACDDPLTLAEARRAVADR